VATFLESVQIMRASLCILLAGCTMDASPAPPPSPVVKQPPPLVKAPPAEATKLAAHFAPEIVGKIEPAEPVAGDYATALDMSFETFPSTEFHIWASRRGALKLTLGADGSARACVGVRDHHGSEGQFHYEPPGKRQHSDHLTAQVQGLAGTWKLVDGVAAVRFDRASWKVCDAASETVVDSPYAELRCVGVATTDRIPAGSLVCETADPQQLLAIGMPMAVDRRVEPRSGNAPRGTGIVLGKPGIKVRADHDRNAREPAFSFDVGEVKLDPKDYQPPKR
jgi:hypothetical protein